MCGPGAGLRGYLGWRSRKSDRINNFIKLSTNANASKYTSNLILIYRIGYNSLCMYALKQNSKSTLSILYNTFREWKFTPKMELSNMYLQLATFPFPLYNPNHPCCPILCLDYLPPANSLLLQQIFAQQSLITSREISFFSPKLNIISNNTLSTTI